MRRVVPALLTVVVAFIPTPASDISETAQSRSTDLESHVYPEYEGLSPSEQRDLEWQARVSAYKTRLLEAAVKDPRFAGARFDNEGERFVLMGVGKPSQELSLLMSSLASVLPSSWETVDYSAAELTDAASSIPRSPSGIQAVEVESDFSGLVAISTSSLVQPPTTVNVKRGEEILAIPIRQEVSGEIPRAGGRGSDSSPFLGGSRVRRPNGMGCSLGFRVIQGGNARMLMARHCTFQDGDNGGNTGIPWAMWGSGDNVGDSLGESLPNQDVQLIDHASYANKIWRGDDSGYETDIAGGSGDPVLDELVCVSGGFSGSQCGYVKGPHSYRTVDVPAPGTFFDLDDVIRVVDSSSDDSIAGTGDSGSPAYTDLLPGSVRMMGIFSAYTDVQPCNGFIPGQRECGRQVFIAVWSRFRTRFDPDLHLDV